jgi:CheY-like chemotaxis protein
MKILIVDDEPLVRLALRRACEKQGHGVTEAEDGRQGIERWAECTPDLVYLDVLMPSLSGPDVLRLRKDQIKDESRAKVILMSAFARDYDLAKANALGADLFIVKPFGDIFAVVKTGEELVRGSKANIR